MLDNLGLAAALRWYLNRVTELTDMEVQLHVPEDFERLSTDIETVFFRTAGEVITNVLRHAQAENLWIQLARRINQVEMHITDDGVGFHYTDQTDPDDFPETLGLSIRHGAPGFADQC